MPDSLAAAIVGHLVGDYLLQNDWMAQGKKRHFWPCLVHVSIYTGCVMLISGWCWHPQAAWLFYAVFIPHYLIDRWGFVPWWMQKIGQDKFLEPPMSPWSRIAVDNSWHLLCLYLTERMATWLMPMENLL